MPLSFTVYHAQCYDSGVRYQRLQKKSRAYTCHTLQTGTATMLHKRYKNRHLTKYILKALAKSMVMRQVKR